jgi:uncharacterized protein YukE
VGRGRFPWTIGAGGLDEVEAHDGDRRLAVIGAADGRLYRRHRGEYHRRDQSRRSIAWRAVVAADCRRGGVASIPPDPVAEARTEMAQAIVNPEELRRFAARLKQFNNEMMTQLTTLHGQLSGLGQSWRDREHDKFVEEFEQTLQVVKRFVDSTNQHIPFLLRKAERIEEYLQQR